MTTTALQVVSLSDVTVMARAVAASGLFPGARTPEAALTLMLVAQSEGLHPMQALRRYHVIEGRPAMSSEAMLAAYQAAGGRITWTVTTDTECSAVFESPGTGGPLTVRWTLDDAKRAGVAAKQNWTRYPRQMLRARVVSEGVRASMPGVVLGMYTPEEVADFDPASRPQTIEAVATTPPVERTPIPAPNSADDARSRAVALAREAVRRLLPRATAQERRAWVERVLGRDVDGSSLSLDDARAILDAADAEGVDNADAA